MAIRKRKEVEMGKYEEVTIEGEPLESVYGFCYLGFEFCADGDHEYGIRVRMEKASKVFTMLTPI